MSTPSELCGSACSADDLDRWEAIAQHPENMMPIGMAQALFSLISEVRTWRSNEATARLKYARLWGAAQGLVAAERAAKAVAEPLLARPQIGKRMWNATSAQIEEGNRALDAALRLVTDLVESERP